MMFYCFELDKVSKEVYTIITSFGKFQYHQLLIGIKVSPNFVQSMIKKILSDLNIDAYMDDIGIWSKGSFIDHIHCWQGIGTSSKRRYEVQSFEV